jgi:hypothetical protein
LLWLAYKRSKERLFSEGMGDTIGNISGAATVDGVLGQGWFFPDLGFLEECTLLNIPPHRIGK